MQIIDLSHLLNNQTPVYPGTEKPTFEKTNTIENDGFAETKINMYSHIGTHMDAPAHMLAGTNTLDSFEVSKFYGKALCIDCTSVKNAEISLDFILPFLKNTDSIDFVLFNTGWSQKWGKDDYFVDFPTLSFSASKYLSSLQLKGVGIDTISIDKMDSVHFENHISLLKSDMVIIENLTDLDKLSSQIFTFSCFPLKFENADGAPVRAVAIIS